jgi:hypothetical protein
MFFFFEIMQLFVEETYFHQYRDTLDKGQSPLPNKTLQEMCLFLAIIAQTGHNHMDSLKDYWLAHEQLHVVSYGNTTK